MTTDTLVLALLFAGLLGLALHLLGVRYAALASAIVFGVALVLALIGR